MPFAKSQYPSGVQTITELVSIWRNLMFAARKAVIKMNNLDIADLLWERKVNNCSMHNPRYSFHIEKSVYFLWNLQFERLGGHLGEIVTVSVHKT